MIRWVLFSVLAIAALAVVCLIGRNTTSGQAAEEEKVQSKSEDETGTAFAVVELFTSEGCSSCPAADDLFGEIVQDAQKRQQRVFGLAFHVDYWNKLGWRDPFSDADFSRRQRDYAGALKTDQVYTPQMIVNGTTEFVGSDRARAHKQIEQALKQPAQADVKLGQEHKHEPGTVVFTYEVKRAAQGTILNVAVVEGGLVSKVGRGENGGRTLHHENVVRTWKTSRLGAAATGTVQLKLPANLVRKNSSVIAYVQDPDTWAVLGATAIELQPADSR
jgi:hypothetical protein